jgi:hypothetical protein
MNRLFVALLIASGISGISFGQNIPSGLGNVNVGDSQKKPPSDQLPAVQKLKNQQMTKGLTNENVNGVPGLNFQGGVAGYAGPPRPSDMAIRSAVYPSPGSAPEVEYNEAIQQAEHERRAEEIRQRALQQQQREIQIQPQRTRTQVHSPVRQDNGMQITPRRQQDRGVYGGDQTGGLVAACGRKGLGVDFVTGSCVSHGGGQINPHNLYPPFMTPLPKPNAGDLIQRCGAQGRTADFVTGRCM